MITNKFGLQLSDFEAFGDFAAAGLEATNLALERVASSYSQHRVPIAGAAVHMAEDGLLSTLAVGNNGRIPAPEEELAEPDPDGIGYPTDHGETATIRQIANISAVDWSRVVFTTSLNPCIMCNRTLSYLWTIGLNKIVVADVSTYGGTVNLLKELKGMTVVELNNAQDAGWMTSFARTYPWDWNADIGNIPPGDRTLIDSIHAQPNLANALVEKLNTALPGNENLRAAVVTPDQKLVSFAVDQRCENHGNPTYSAPMLAMGRAGSAVNLQECVLVCLSSNTEQALGIHGFGHSSLGACELFKPGTILTNCSFDSELANAIGAINVPVLKATN